MLKNNKFVKYRNNRLYRLNVDLFGNVLKLRAIHKNFKQLYNRFYRKLFKRSLNIFFRLRNLTIIKRKYSRRLNHVRYTQKLSIFKFYKNLNRTQFRNLFFFSMRSRSSFFSIFFNKLENRLDMFLYRSFSSISLFFITQLIRHKHVFVNSKVISYTNFILSPGDVVFFTRNAFIRIYLFLKKNLKTKNKKLILHKFPKYIEASFIMLVSVFVSTISFKEIPFYFKTSKYIIARLF